MVKFISSSRSIDTTNQYSTCTLQECINYCESKSILGLDTETEGLDFLTNRMVMLQIGDKDQQFVIDTREVNINDLAPILENNNILKVLHNAKFDYKFIKRWGNATLQNVYDTMLSEKLLVCGREGWSVSLGATLQRRCDITLSKQERVSFLTLQGRAFTNSQVIYGAKDVEYLLNIREKQLQEIQTLELGAITDLENQAVIVFAEIEYEGLLLDTKSWTSLAESNSNKVFESIEELDTAVTQHPQLQSFNLPTQGDLFADTIRKTYINWNSPAQVLRLFQCLFPKLEDVNGKNLLKYRKNDIIKRYIKYKEQSKLINAYGTQFFKYVNIDGKVHTNFSQILDTGRVSSSKPNMQQIPSDNAYRNCFNAPNDWVFVSSDYSSQELNVIAYGSQDPVWLQALENKQDLHSVCADLVYGEQWLDAAEDDCNYLLTKGKCNCPKHKLLRTNVKTVNFGLAYGMGPKKLSETIEVSMTEAKELITKYFHTFPAIKGFLDKLGEFGVKNGYIRTFKPFKRRRWFDNWYPKMYSEKGAEFGSIERASKNTPIQGSSADMTKLALIYIHNRIKETNLPVKIIMTVHDQIDTICEETYAEEWKEIMTELMEQAAKVIIPNGLLKADTNISKTWEK